MMDERRWNTGYVQKARGKGGDRKHIGMVQHMYGPYRSFSWVRTLCGMKGRMMGKTTQEPTSIQVDCKLCLRSFAKAVQVKRKAAAL